MPAVCGSWPVMAIRYPMKGYVINGLEKFNGKDGYYCFHAGTKLTDKGIVTNGGRVLGVDSQGATLKEARANAYEDNGMDHLREQIHAS